MRQSAHPADIMLPQSYNILQSLLTTNKGVNMLTMRKTNGETIKLKNKQFKKYFADLMDSQLRSEILKALKQNVKELDGDGHSIEDPKFYINNVGLPTEFVFGVAQKHYSDFRNPKSTITNNKFGVCDYVFGVSTLSMLERLANIVGWDSELRERYSNLSGRGFMARVCLDNIKKQIESINEKDLEPEYIDPSKYMEAKTNA